MGIQTKLCKHGLFSYFTNDIIIGKSLELYGEYAENEFLLLNHVVQPGDFVLDIGANLGLHNVWFAKHAFKGQVAAFEPNEFNRNLLIKMKRDQYTPKKRELGSSRNKKIKK